MKRIPGDKCSSRKNRTFVKISITLRLLSLRGGLFLKLLFQSYKYRLLMLITINLAYIFVEANELNIAFPFVILTSQNCIQRNKLYQGI